MNPLHELLRSPAPGDTLLRWHASGELAAQLPEVDRLFGVPQRAEHHPEVDTGIHVALCLDAAHRIGASPQARFAVLLHDLGKALTPVHALPAHIGHETRGLVPVLMACDRLGVSNDWRRLALLVCEYHLHAHRVLEMRSKSVLKLLHETGLETDLDLLDNFVDACEADKRGRLGKEKQDYPQGRLLRQAARALQNVPVIPWEPFKDRVYEERHSARLRVVRTVRKRFETPTVAVLPAAQTS